MVVRSLVLGSLTILALLMRPSHAAAQGFFEGPRLLALGGAARATGTGNDAIYSNAAGIALSESYSVEVSYLDDLHGQSRVFNSSILDSQAGPVSAGLAYTFRDQGLDLDSTTHRIDSAVAIQVYEGLAIGMTGRYQNTSVSRDDVELEDESYNIFTFDAGLQWRSSFGLSLGVTGYNLTASDRPEFPISWGAGLGYIGEIFAVEGGLRYDTTNGKARIEGGALIVLAELIPIRMGVTYDRATESVFVSAGVGFLSEHFSADIAYRQRVVHGSLADSDFGDRNLGIAARALF